MKYLLAALVSCLSIVIYAQNRVTGIVLDSITGEVLIGAYVLSHDGNTITDENGEFSLDVKNIPVEIEVSFIGFETRTVGLSAEKGNIVRLLQRDNVLDIMTVTASKYKKRLSESTVSVEVLKPELISSINTVDIDGALEKVPGVQMIDGQANIRGGSGYSYGAGSRVMLLIDDMPALQVDAGFPNWGDVPVENIAQVEILKGAASALYGSSALNGIINIRTGNPEKTPRTTFSTAYTLFGDPSDSSKIWYGDSSRYQLTTTLLHKQKIGKLDVVLGGFYTKLKSYNESTFENRKRANLKLQYQVSDRVFVRLNGLINKGDNGDFFIWQNDSTGIYRPFNDSPATSKNLRYMIDPSLRIEDKYGNHHKFQSRYHYINNENNNDQGNKSNTIFGEYQFQRYLEYFGLTSTLGLVYQKSNTDSELFGDTTFTAKNTAAYIQLDKKIRDKFNFSIGTRYEYNKQITPSEFNGIVIPNGEVSEGEFIARLGMSYEYAPYSSIRASWGQGYRLPTITEKFITTTFAGFNIFPSPLLESERGWTAELGIKQAFKAGDTKGYLDLSLFTSEYDNMTEFTVNFDQLPTIGFSSQNVGDTKISGIDIGMFGSVNLGVGSLELYGGYTFLVPRYKNFEGDSIILAGISTDQNVLKYRSTHNLKMDIEYKYRKFTIGGSIVHASHQINIDKPLENIFGSGLDIVRIGRFRMNNPNGYVRTDIRTSYTYENWKFSFLVNNIANIEYTVRPGLLEAPRNYNLRLDYSFNWK